MTKKKELQTHYTTEQKDRRLKALELAEKLVSNPAYRMDISAANVVSLGNILYNHAEGADVLAVAKPEVPAATEEAAPQQTYG